MSAKEKSTPPHKLDAAELARLTETTKALTQATKLLRAHEDATGCPAGSDPLKSVIQDSEKQNYYERLEQAGQLVDVAEDTDLSRLPPHVTHIRRPDGTIKRIGFSSSPL